MTVIDRADDGRRLSPMVARRQLLHRFVRARKEAGFASRELAAKALGWSPRKQALLECDDQPIPQKDLEVILSTFKIPEKDWPTWHTLSTLARAQGWWDTFEEADLSAEGKRFVGLEWGARRIRTFDGTILPPLLQLPGYTIAALHAGITDRPPEQINRLLAVRRQRQRALGQPDPLTYHVVLDEAALRRPGGDPQTMRAQLGHIVDLARTRPNITIQVVPFTAGLYAAQSGPFLMMDFDTNNTKPDVEARGHNSDDHGLIHIEPGFASSLYIEERQNLYLYSRVFQRLTETALPPAQSLELIQTTAKHTQGN